MTAPGEDWKTGRLTVKVVSARGLAAVDKSGSSDPFVVLQLVDHEGKALGSKKDQKKTKVIKQNLNPKWENEFYVFDNVENPLPTIEFKVYDWNATIFGLGTGKPKPLGMTRFKLEQKIHLKTHLKLQPFDTIKSAAGELEIEIQLEPGTGDAEIDAQHAADSTQWFLPESATTQAPNLLRIAVVRARNLCIGDKNTFSAGGSSDPYVVLKYKKQERTKVINKNLNPIWCQQFEFELLDQHEIELQVWDKDLVPGSDDFLGKLIINIHNLPPLNEDGSAPATWYPLADNKNAPATDRGQICLALKKCYDPALDPNEDRPFFEDANDDDLQKSPNELLIAIARARGLQAKDIALPFSSQGSRSDPYTIMKLDKMTKKTKTITQNLSPVWNETFAIDLIHSETNDQRQIEFTVMDYDLVGQDDFLGYAVLKVNDLADRKPFKRWFALGTKDQVAGGDGSLGQLLIAARWRYNRELDFNPLHNDDDLQPQKPANELKVALFRGRNLAIKDKALLYGQGSSDPRCRFRLVGTAEDKEWSSSVRKKTLDPIWRQVFTEPLKLLDTSRENSSTPPTLEIICEDWDEVTHYDFAGRIDIPLEQLIKQRPFVLNGWHQLQADSTQKTSNISGEISLQVQALYNPTYDFDPWSDDDFNLSKRPNELRIALVRGRDLAVKDKAIFYGQGASDPRVRFFIEDLPPSIEKSRPFKKIKSKVKTKTLEPEWLEIFIVPIDAPIHGEWPAILTCIVEDHDTIKSDFMGKSQINLEPLIQDLISQKEVPKQRRLRQWCKLTADDSSTSSSNVSGEIEVIVQWAYNPDRDFDPWAEEAEEEEENVTAHGPANELRIAAVQGRDLAVMDTAMLYGQGSSDPFLTLAVQGANHLRAKTKYISKCCNPIWREQWVFELAEDNCFDPKTKTKIDFGPDGPLLKVECFDYDSVSSNDLCGTVDIPLTALGQNGKRRREWYEIKDAKGEPKGEVELIIQWHHNPSLVFDPFLELDEFADKEPNEILIGLAQGRDLAIKDKPVLYGQGSSDPRVTFVVGDMKQQSSTQKKTLNPRWNEVFKFASLTPGSEPTVLKVHCQDVDLVSAADDMGSIEILLNPDKVRQRQWYPLLEVENGSKNIKGELDIVTRWVYNPVHDYDPFSQDEENNPENKAANELRIAVVQGRSLAITNKNLLSKGGSSDPFISLQVKTKSDQVSAQFKTEYKPKTLNPIWRQVFQVPITSDDEAVRIDGQVFDFNTVTSNIPMGDFSIDLANLERSSKPIRKWYTLENSTSEQISGECELIIQRWYNPALDFEPFQEVESEDHPPNEVRVAIVRGQDLAIKDKAILYGEGSSDPRVRVEIRGTDHKAKTTVKSKSLAPVWRETFEFPYVQGPEYADVPMLDLFCEDVDQASSADFLGSVRIPLLHVLHCPGRRQRAWFDLQADADGSGLKTSTNVSGSLEIIVNWHYNQALSFTAFDEGVNNDESSGKKPNEIRLALFEARALHVTDSSCLKPWLSSDSVMTFTLKNTQFKSTVKRKTMNPIWNEVFTEPVPVVEEDEIDIETMLEVSCHDWNALTKNKLVGRCEIALDDYAQPKRAWYKLLSTDNNEIGAVELSIQYRWNPILDFSPFSNSDAQQAHKKPNFLRIGLSRAKGLAIGDKNLLTKGGTSDPRATFEILTNSLKANNLKCVSTIKNKTLDPVWREVMTLEYEEESDSVLRCTIEDADTLSAADYLGEFEVSLSTLNDQRVVKTWYPLAEKRGSKVEVSGQVEVVLHYIYDPSYDWQPFSVEEDDDAKQKEANELRVGISRCRNLAIMDHNLLSKGGSSDPRVKFRITGTDLEKRTKFKSKTLDPVYKEIFALPLTVSGPGSRKPSLTIEVEDYDVITSADEMGSCVIDLESLIQNRTISKSWYTLVGPTNSQEDAGQIQVVLSAWCNPHHEFDPFLADDDEPEKPPNELRIGLHRAMDLAIKDVNLLSKGGSSDPRMKFALPGHLSKPIYSSTIKKSLNPVWKEVFAFPVHRGPEETKPPILECICEDVDTLSKADRIGSFQIDLATLVDHHIDRKWYALASDDENGSGHVALVCQWRYSPVYDYNPFTQEVTDTQGEANELRIALVQARGLAAKDHNLISRDSSDPRFTFCLIGGSEEIVLKSLVKKQTVDPVYKETWSRQLQFSKNTESRLECVCEDVDTLSKNDFLGKVEIDLAPLAEHRRPERAWYDLQGESGQVELICQWRHSVAYGYEVFEDSDPCPDMPPNVLRIALVQARDLVVRDKNLFSKGGTSDPRATFTLAEEIFQSTVKAKTLSPVWRETWSKKVSASDAKLTVSLDDIDTLTAADPLGSFVVPLSDVAATSGRRLRKWFTLEGVDSGECELVLTWRYDEAYDLELAERRRQAELEAAKQKREEVKTEVVQSMEPLLSAPLVQPNEIDEKEPQGEEEEEERKRQEEEEVKRRQQEEDETKRRAAIAEAERRRKAREAALKKQTEEKIERRRQAEAEAARRNEARREAMRQRDEAERKARLAELQRKKRAEREKRQVEEERQRRDEEERERRRRELKAWDEERKATARRAAAKRRAAEDQRRKQRLEQEAERLKKAKEARQASDTARRQAEARRRAEEMKRLQVEAEAREAKRSEIRRKRVAEEARQKNEAEQRRLATEKKRVDYERNRLERLRHYTQARLEREAEERLQREHELSAALSDRSRHWSSGYATRDDFVFPPPPPSSSREKRRA